MRNLVTSKLPTWAVALTIICCALPWLTSYFGLSLGINLTDSDVNYLLSHATTQNQPLSHALHNAFKLHAVLEWIIISISILTGFIAFNHYRLTHDITTPVIGTFVIFAGVLDASESILMHFQLDQMVNIGHTIPYLWAVNRICSATLMVAGIVFILFLGGKKRHVRSFFIVLICVFLLFSAYTIMYFFIFIHPVPLSSFPDILISRPWDIIPLSLYLISGLFLLPRFHKRINTLFSHALLISMIPFVCSELYMAFGSKRIFDAYFCGAHFVLASAYIVLLIGLMLDYIKTYRESIAFHEALAETQQKLSKAEQINTAIVDDAVDGIIVINGQGLIEIFNTASEKMFGYPANEVIGNNVSVLMPSPYREAHNGYIEQYFETGKKKIIGVGGRELTALRKNGSIFPINLSIHEIIFQDEHKFAAILRDITEIKRAEKELIQAKDLAEQANTAKSSFLTTMTHELRTPLTAIIGFSNCMLDGMDGPISEPQKESLNTITQAGEHLLDIINNLLDLSKIEAGQINLQIEKIDLSELCDQCIETIQPLAKRKNILLNKSFSQEPLWIEADAVKIRQVIINLLGNAVKFTERGEVLLKAEISNETAIVQVKDTGIGLKQDELVNVFDAFTQADHSLSRKYGGTGLGLSISKKIIELHNGTINVTSEKDKGSTFIFYLPFHHSLENNKSNYQTNHANDQNKRKMEPKL